jgi:hypothetical protein
MKKTYFFILILLCLVKANAQQKITVCQKCSRHNITIFYKDGVEGAYSCRINDSCTEYIIPLSEPSRLVILTDDETRNIEYIWVDPRFKNRKVIIDYCNTTLVNIDTIALDLDDEPYQKMLKDAKLGIITTNTFLNNTKIYQEQYIQANPDSFLSLYYLREIMTSITKDQVAKYLHSLNYIFSKSPKYSEIQLYINSYKYKSVPKIGDPFYEFQALTLSGEKFYSNNILNKVIILYFCYSGCGSCKTILEPLCKMYEKHKSKGLELITLSLENDTLLWYNSVEKHCSGYTVTELVGFNSPLFLHYNVSAFPFFIVFNREKKISLITFGSNEIPLLETEISKMLEYHE